MPESVRVRPGTAGTVNRLCVVFSRLVAAPIGVMQMCRAQKQGGMNNFGSFKQHLTPSKQHRNHALNENLPHQAGFALLAEDSRGVMAFNALWGV